VRHAYQLDVADSRAILAVAATGAHVTLRDCAISNPLGMSRPQLAAVVLRAAGQSLAEFERVFAGVKLLMQ
jgi:hypothetical protein